MKPQYRHGPAARRIVVRALELTLTMPEPLRGAQRRAIYNVLSQRMRAVLEAIVMDPNKIPETEEARRTRLIVDAAFDRAEARGEARALLALFDARGLMVSEEQRARVLACTDAATLESWVRRAATASSVTDVLD